MLVANGHVSKSHEGTIQLFGLHFVNKGIVPQEKGKLVRILFKCRLTGDYSDKFDLTEEDVMPLFEPTEQLIEEVTALAKQAISK